MNGYKKNKLSAPEAMAKISAGERGCFQEASWRRLHRWSRLYFLTAVAAILSVGVLLLSGSVSESALSQGSFWGRGAEALGTFFLKEDFFFSAHDGSEREEPFFQGIVDVIDQILHPEENGKDLPGNEEETPEENTKTEKVPSADDLYAFDYDAVPDGKSPVIPMNLSLSSYGPTYIHNSTGYKPDTAALLAGTLKQTADFEYLAASGLPLVLIVHTHATESFCEEGATYCDTSVEYARSKNPEENMIAVGKTLAEELQRRGIATLQCTVMHDEVQYKDSYRRSEESIRQYLEKYPTIRLVIDLHRDAIVQSDGDVVRPVTLYDGEPAAQLMCVIGSDFGGETCPNWKQNLALALKLRELLNQKCPEICRPPYLKSSTYNQELAPYSLLVEAGAGGNSLSEVRRSMGLLADALCEIFSRM